MVGVGCYLLGEKEKKCVKFMVRIDINDNNIRKKIGNLREKYMEDIFIVTAIHFKFQLTQNVAQNYISS